MLLSASQVRSARRLAKKTAHMPLHPMALEAEVPAHSLAPWHTARKLLARPLQLLRPCNCCGGLFSMVLVRRPL